LFLFIFYLIII